VSATEARLGQTVGGKYRILRFLAAGGMGVVYEAQHVHLGRRFAIKFLRPELLRKRESLVRFQREAQAADALESENVTAVIDFGIVADGSPYLVMEYLVGENLGRLLAREGPLPLERASELVLQASHGVQAAHAAGIVHRDLKPPNLFACRREDGTELVKVLDFGVAKLGTFDEANSATRTGSVLGTPAYMSPEQARGEKNIDHRADVYALGAILYELVSGQRPHPGDSPNAILHHISTQPAVPLEAIRPTLPRAFLEIVARALAAQPEQRFPSAEALAQALAPFARRAVWPAPPLEVPLPLVQPTGSARARLPWVLAIAGIAVVFTLVLMRPPHSDPPVRSLPAPARPPPTAQQQSSELVPPVTMAVASAEAPAPIASAPRRQGERPGGRPPESIRRAPAKATAAHSGSVTFDQHNPYN